MSQAEPTSALRHLPSVGRCLSSAEGKELQSRYGTRAVTHFLQDAVSGERERIRTGEGLTARNGAELLSEVAEKLARLFEADGRRAINATGIILHTGLGRSPLSDDAIAAISQLNRYSLLEIDLPTGERSKREDRAEALLRALTGAEAATVVNNNAAATFLILNTLAKGKEVPISRGQLIEIGGSFRMPDVMTQSGATLIEVGTTNRTYVRDYEAHIGPNTALLMHVHTSNYRIRGFSEMPGIGDLAPLAKRRGIPLVDDMGSGAFLPLEQYGLRSEPMIAESLAAGADIICFSGDKLLGGPQGGIILGPRAQIEAMRKNPFFRMFRPDKLCLAALETTLVTLLRGSAPPALAPDYLMSRSVDELQQRADALLELLQPLEGGCAESVRQQSYIGGGSLPDESLPSVAVRISPHGDARKRAGELAARLRLHRPSVLGRVDEGTLLFDLRTVFPDELPVLAEALLATITRE